MDRRSVYRDRTKWRGRRTWGVRYERRPGRGARRATGTDCLSCRYGGPRRLAVGHCRRGRRGRNAGDDPARPSRRWCPVDGAHAADAGPSARGRAVVSHSRAGAFGSWLRARGGRQRAGDCSGRYTTRCSALERTATGDCASRSSSAIGCRTRCRSAESRPAIGLRLSPINWCARGGTASRLERTPRRRRRHSRQP